MMQKATSPMDAPATLPGWDYGEITEPRTPDFEWIDAHAHMFSPIRWFFDGLPELGPKIVNICVVDPIEPSIHRLHPEAQHKLARQVAEISEGRAPWVATFDPADWLEDGFALSAIEVLGEAFDNGAVGVKIYKTIGMLLRYPDGAYLMPDDPVFDPIFAYIENRDRTVYAHLAEPLEAWEPPNPTSPHYRHFHLGDGKAWNSFEHPTRPSWQDITDARNRMVERHPGLRVIDCHMAGMSHDLSALGDRFRRYPNLAVDTSSQVKSLMLLNSHEQVREFCIEHQDRILYGLDGGVDLCEDPEVELRRWNDGYERDWKYFSTSGTQTIGDREIRCLDLPEDVLRKVFHDNALRWVPGLAGSG